MPPFAERCNPIDTPLVLFNVQKNPLIKFLLI